MQTSYIKGVKLPIRENNFYKLLPPKLKNKLAMNILEEYYECFYYFFHDLNTQKHADEVFIRRILSRLDC